jgi:hypothetical protein
MAEERRPASIRPATWNWIPEDAKRRISRGDRVGPVVLQCGILDHPELLTDTVIEFEDGVELVISEISADRIANRLSRVVLRRLYVVLPAVFEALGLERPASGSPAFVGWRLPLPRRHA